jgi:HEAT repeat protein
VTRIKQLLGMLHNPDYHLRAGAVYALRKRTSQRAIELLLDHLGEFDPADEESKVNRAASQALAHIGEPALNPLIDALRQKREQPNDDWRRSWIASTLGLMKDARAVDSLLEALQDEQIRGTVAEALADIGDKRALGPLLQILPQSRAYAEIAIKAAIKTLHPDNEVSDE